MPIPGTDSNNPGWCTPVVIFRFSSFLKFSLYKTLKESLLSKRPANS